MSKTQKSKFALSATLACAAVGMSNQASAFSYPTKWVIDNQTNSSVTLSCEGETVGAGVLKDLRSVRVSAKTQTVYTWRDFYYNDGLGLNAASWYCRDTASGTVLERFSTDWGEEVRLVLTRQGNRVSLTKY